MFCWIKELGFYANGKMKVADHKRGKRCYQNNSAWRWMFLCISFFCGIAAYAQNTGKWPYQHIDKKAGLSNSAINAIYMDKHDFVWFGTWDGLNRYDENNIATYKPDPFRKGSISNNIVREFLEDRRGNLWIITHSGINKYNRDLDIFDSYPDNISSLPFQEYSLRACIGPDSGIWISLIGWGVGRYVERDDSFTHVSMRGVSDKWLKTVVGIGYINGTMYMISDSSELKGFRNNNLLFSLKIPQGVLIKQHRFLEINHTNYLALAVKGGGIILYNLSSPAEEPVHVNFGTSTVSSISSTLDKKSVWIGNESGQIFRLNFSKKSVTAEQVDFYLPKLTQKKIKILSVTETRQDILWIGTDGDGVYKILTKERAFYSILSGKTDQGQLSHSIVRSIYEDPDGTLFVGTRGGGMNVINKNRDHTKAYNTSNGLSDDAVLALKGDQKGNIWIGLDAEGIDMLEKKTGRLYHFPRDFSHKTELYFSSVYAICIDSNNHIWLGTSGHGVIHMQIEKNASGHYELVSYEQLGEGDNHAHSGMISNIVYAIAEERPGIMWFGSRGGGLYCYNSYTHKFVTSVKADADDSYSLSNNDILSLSVDRGKNLWIGTSGGLNYLKTNAQPFQVEHYTQYQGLPSNTIHGILTDRSGLVWLSTNNGLALFDPSRKTFRIFDWNDGLQNSEFTDGAAFKSPDSRVLYFGGIEGLDMIYPQKLDTSNFIPRLAITEFQVHNVIVNPGDHTGILDKSIDNTDKITLGYKQNFISFHFSVLDYWNKQRCSYAYYLENLDKDWNLLGRQNFINLIKVPPGKYKLKIKYTNENGVWSKDYRTIDIVITPPFWATRLAYLVYLILLLGIQLGIVIFIRKRARAKRLRAMERFKRDQAEKLSNYKLQFFTNIAHEFRTPLTLIMGPVITLMKSNNDPSAVKTFSTIYKNVLRMQKLISELIEFRKVEIGKETLEVVEKDIVSFTGDVVDSFSQFAIEREIDLRFEPFAPVLTGFVDTQKLESILLNLISNAIKYCPSGSIVTVGIEYSDGVARFRVKDTGIGMSPAIIEKIFDPFYHSSEFLPEKRGIAKGIGIGLALTKSLVELHKGKIWVDSKLGEGSCFYFEIPVDEKFYAGQIKSGEIMVSNASLKDKITSEFESSEYNTDSKTTDKKDSFTDFELLVVDDNPQILMMLDNLFSSKYIIHTANSGLKALEVLKNEKIDLVISDIMMPDMDGLTLCKHIKEDIETSHIPVILLTAKGEIEQRIEGLQVGADSYIPKPFHPDHLSVRVEKLIENRELLREKFKSLSTRQDEPISSGISKKDDEFLSKVMECIEKNLNESEFDADQIADYVGMGKTSLYKKIKSITGLTPHLLINQFRLKRAAHLLRTSNLTVSEVIYETGFNSRSYFYKTFHEMFQCSPKEFQ